MENKEICGKCKYHKPANPYYMEDNEFLCDNEGSEYYSDYTDYTDSCEEFEER